MIENLREWVTYCVKIEPRVWCTMMRQCAFYRKHLILDRSWEPNVPIGHKTAHHARTWALMSLDDVDQYNDLLSKIQAARTQYHKEKT